jgi:proteasome lid subunit RPN8/RPN11
MVDSVAAPMRVDGDVVNGIEDHVHSDVGREVGGILVGTRANRAVRVEAGIPALKAVGERTNVTFTHDVWDDVHARIESEYPGKDIVGWYHSHPGFGIFLSGYDRFIHENFFSDPPMIALVVDPLAGQLGWFGWVRGEVTLLEQGPSRKATAAAAPDITPQRRRRGTAILVGGALVATSLGLGFGLGSASHPVTEQRGAVLSPAASDVGAVATELRQVTAERDQLRASRDRLKEELRKLRGSTRGSTVIRYIVQPGDSLWRISAALKGSGFDYASIRRTNTEARDGIDPGDVLLIQVPPSAERS